MIYVYKMKNLKIYRMFENYNRFDSINKDDTETKKADDFQSSWSKINNKLQREFKFGNFQKALEFINEISIICEDENHHPEINWVYNKITLKLSTHDSGDIITGKDIELSKLIDECYL